MESEPIQNKMESEHPNPWSKANCISRIFFWWVIPLFLKGAKGMLKPNDIFECPNEFSTERVGEIMQKEWDKELTKIQKGKQPSIYRAIARSFGMQVIWNGVIIIFERCVLNVLLPIMLCFMVEEYATIEGTSSIRLYMYTAAICLLVVIYACTFQIQVFGAENISLNLQVACCTLVYRKALKLSPLALRRTNAGQMVNLLSKDVNMFVYLMYRFPYLLVSPLMTVIITSVLWMYVGYASVAGVSVLILYLPLMTMSGNLFSKFRKNMAIVGDERMSLMSEVINGMRVIKLYGWERPFTTLVDEIRRKEVHEIRNTAILRSISMSLFQTSSKMILLIVFSVFVNCIQGELTPEKVFICFAFFNFLRIMVANVFPLAIKDCAEGKVSLQRIQTFLLLEERESSSHLDWRPNRNQCGIWLRDVTTSWNENGDPALSNITLSVKPGELLIVVGPVGCGKSSLLMSILGELRFLAGEVKLRGKVAYATQDPWIFSGSVKQNIVFGSKMNESRYRKVLSICALAKDIQEFSHGDETDVGEQGVILSRGQRSRINFARAIYFDADIFLLDDPLSSVDSAVSKHLFTKCINGYLKKKARILVTHHIEFLKAASQILVLSEGKCVALGTYEELRDRGVDFGSVKEVKKQLYEQAPSLKTLKYNCPSNVPAEIADKRIDSKFSDSYKPVKNKTKQLVEEEKTSLGAVKCKIYKEYVRSGAGLLLQFVILASLILSQIFFVGSDFWISFWAKHEQSVHNIKECWAGINKTFLRGTSYYNDSYGLLGRGFSRITVNNVSEGCFLLTHNYTEDESNALMKRNSNYYVHVYAGLVMILFIFSLIKEACFFQMCTKASVTLHNKMFYSMIRSPTSFFDSTPIGNILNRCSRDLNFIDDIIPTIARDSIETIFVLSGVISVVAIVKPWLLLPSLIISFLFFICRRLYMPTSRSTQRYEAITRSPVFSHLNTSLYGLATIRAFKEEQSFEETFSHYQNRHASTWFTLKALTHVFGAAIDWLSVVFVISVTIAMIMFSDDPSYASAAGLAVATTFQLFGAIQWGIQLSTDLENQMVSVERVIEYSNLDSEAALESSNDKKTPTDWPNNGHVIFKNVNLRYFKDEPPVLKNLCFEIYPKEKIGIVGRTGAGKSSLITALFRMTEPEGIIMVDGINIKNIGLHELRRNISIVPQDPILFTGPVRRNLDPFNEHSDTQLWQSLQKAHLSEFIKELPGGLDSPVSEKGKNFSIGQRQLICLARAMLRRKSILVLDEATANVDHITDHLIQMTIKEHFSDCTVLTVAHRLHTVIHCDRIIVLDVGEIKEFDEPYALLRNRNSYFSKLVQMTGPTMAQELLKAARAVYLRKKMPFQQDCMFENDCSHL